MPVSSLTQVLKTALLDAPKPRAKAKSGAGRAKEGKVTPPPAEPKAPALRQ